MLTPRRWAQFGLGAASFVLVASVAVLLAGAADVPATGQQDRVAPLAQSQVVTVSADASTVRPAAPQH